MGSVCGSLRTRVRAFSVSKCLSATDLPLLLAEELPHGDSQEDVYRAVVDAGTAVSPLCHLVDMVNRFLTTMVHQLTDDSCIERVLYRLEQTYALRSTVASRLLVAHATQRVLLEQLLNGGVPMHASPSRLYHEHRDTSSSLRGVLSWLNQNSVHPALGSLCASVHCTASRFCREARQLRGDEHSMWSVCTPGARVVVGITPVEMYFQYINRVDDRVLLRSASGSTIRLPTHAYFDIASPSPHGAFHPISDSKLPEEVWRTIGRFLPPEEWGCIAHINHALFNMVFTQPEYAVLRHHMASKQLDALQSQHTDIFWEKLFLLYNKYSTNYQDMLRMQDRSHQLRREGDALLTTMQIAAGTFISVSRKERDEVLVPRLRDLDFRLLRDYAMDSVETGCDSISALPPRAFWEGSKHRKSMRREFTDPNLTPDSAGVQLLSELACARDELANGRNALGRVLRRIEAGLLARLHRLMEEIRDCPLVSTDIDHPLALLSQDNELVLGQPEMEGVLRNLLHWAERATPAIKAVAATLKELRHAVAAKLPGLPQQLVRGMVRSPSPETEFLQWKKYLGHLAQSRGCSDTGLCLRVVLDMDMDEATVKHGLVVHYVESPCYPTTGTLTNFLRLHCLEAVGMWDVGEVWPPRGSLGKGDLSIVWTEDPDADPIVVLKNVHVQPHKAAHTFSAMTEGDINLLAMLRNHGVLTGRCAPCGRAVPNKEPYIGSTCSGHLYTATQLSHR